MDDGKDSNFDKSTVDVEKRVKKHDMDAKTKHWSDKSLEDMTERDWRIFREDHEIIIRGGRVPAPIQRLD